MLQNVIMGLLTIAVLASVGLQWRAQHSGAGPPHPQSVPGGSFLTGDQLEAALTPFRVRLAALEAATESLEGKIARARQLSAKDLREQQRVELAEAVQDQLATRRATKGAVSEGSPVESEDGAPSPPVIVRANARR